MCIRNFIRPWVWSIEREDSIVINVTIVSIVALRPRIYSFLAQTIISHLFPTNFSVSLLCRVWFFLTFSIHNAALSPPSFEYLVVQGCPITFLEGPHWPNNVIYPCVRGKMFMIRALSIPVQLFVVLYRVSSHYLTCSELALKLAGRVSRLWRDKQYFGSMCTNCQLAILTLILTFPSEIIFKKAKTKKKACGRGRTWGSGRTCGRFWHGLFIFSWFVHVTWFCDCTCASSCGHHSLCGRAFMIKWAWQGLGEGSVIFLRVSSLIACLSIQ